MKSQLLLLIILLLFYKAISDDEEYEECSDFETKKIQAACSSLKSISGTFCYYSEGKCHEWYRECLDYRPENNNKFDDNICNQIIPFDKTKKCIVQIEDDIKYCIPINKECTDHTSYDDCVNLNVGTEKRCVLSDDDKCTEHFDSCDKIKDETTCNKNIPINKLKKCEWDGENKSCQEVNRKCEDYKLFSDKIGISECSDNFQKEDLNAHCFLYNNLCIEAYKSCNGLTESKCESIIKVKDSSVTINQLEIDKHKKCVWELETCREKSRECKDYKKEEDTEDFCKELSPKESNRDHAICYLDGEECKEIPIKCEDYHQYIETDSNKRSAGICTKIKPRITGNNQEIDEHSECIFDANNECKTQPKECNKFQDEEKCLQHPIDSLHQYMRCIFNDKGCSEDYKDCTSYNNKVQTNKNPSDCKSITPFIKNNKYYQCTFNDASNICEDENDEMECEDYKGIDIKICREISKNLEDKDSGIYNCAINKNKCIKQFKECPGETQNIDRETCESIVLYDEPYKRCFFENDKNCVKRERLCNEYSGDDKEECSKYRASYDNRECIIENGKCIEKYKEKKYKYCSEYHGTDKFICESIQPYKTENIPDYSSRCVYGSHGCERESINCNEAKDILECESIIHPDKHKKCIFKDNVCVEQFRNCDLYEIYGETINRQTCESIIINDAYDLPNALQNEDPYKYKCVFHQEEGSNALNRCTIEERICEDFKNDLITSQCLNINQILDRTKKCSYMNNNCTPIDKTCLELEQIDTVTADICKAASTSSPSKICSLKVDETDETIIVGCEELENKDYVYIEEKPREKKNSDGNKYKNKIIKLLLFFLI